MLELDPEVEAGAIALAFVEKPCNIPATREAWWNTFSPMRRDVYLYRASIVLEAVDELRSAPDANA